MMSAAAIASLSKSIGARARLTGKKPAWFTADQDTGKEFQPGGPDGHKNGRQQFMRLIPNIGDYRPKGFKLVDDMMVDKSGFGSENEPALTVRQFALRLQHGKAYAIVEEGQFQVIIGVFEPAAVVDGSSVIYRDSTTTVGATIDHRRKLWTIAGMPSLRIKADAIAAWEAAVAAALIARPPVPGGPLIHGGVNLGGVAA
jgi:hypothetical protein